MNKGAEKQMQNLFHNVHIGNEWLKPYDLK